ncbi:hypothetical protein WA158_000986 [Blastocystis sp. Blastoise]
MKRANSLEEESQRIRRSSIESYDSQVSVSDIDDDDYSLPILAFKDEILKTVTQNKVTIIVGETGSGKSTQIPQFLMNAGLLKDRCVAVSQPRRVAAITLARRVAEEINTECGKEVGYTIRFDDNTCSSTQIKYITDGCLMRECLSDKQLEKYSYIMIDEAHERSIHTDILLGLLKSTILSRDDVHVIITSATLNIQQFADFYQSSAVIQVPGRVFPVDIFHNKNIMTNDINLTIEKGVEVVEKIHIQEQPGHVLFFLPGQSDIEMAYGMISDWYNEQRRKHTKMMKMDLFQLYGALPSNKQKEIFSPSPDDTRKIVLCTNICETSITINAVRYVVDSGFKKEKVYNAKEGIEKLVYTRISKVNAEQRAGRAGRTCAGKCYRIYSTQIVDMMEERDVPEIQRDNLINTVLYLKVLNIDDILNFPFLDPPEPSFMKLALKQLYMLECIDIHGKITELGRKVSSLPLDPTLARSLLISHDYDCIDECIKIAAMLSVENIYYSVSNNEIRTMKGLETRQTQIKSMNYRGDQITLLNVFNNYMKNGRSREWCEENYVHQRALEQTYNIYKQIKEIMQTTDISIQPSSLPLNTLYDNISTALCKGYMFNIGKRLMNGMYRTVVDLHEGGGTRIGLLHPSSALSFLGQTPEYIVFNEIVQTSKLFFRNCIEVNENTVIDVCKKIQEIRDTVFDPDDNKDFILDPKDIVTTEIPVEMPEKKIEPIVNKSSVTQDMFFIIKDIHI